MYAYLYKIWIYKSKLRATLITSIKITSLFRNWDSLISMSILERKTSMSMSISGWENLIGIGFIL